MAVVAELPEHATEVTVIGGLTVDYLAEAGDAPHQGTVDVDLHVELGLVFDRDESDLSWLEHALDRAGFAPIGSAGWRWRMEVGGTPVVLDLLCDVPDHLDQEIALPGCTRAGAMNLPGPRAAALDAVERAIGAGSGRESVTVRFAGLGGYVLAKASAVHHRGKDKDLYDLAFMLLHNQRGGPVEAGRAAFHALPVPDFANLRSVFPAAVQRLTEVETAQVYAEQRGRDGDEVDADVLVQDVIGAAMACTSTFRELMG